MGTNSIYWEQYSGNNPANFYKDKNKEKFKNFLTDQTTLDYKNDIFNSLSPIKYNQALNDIDMSKNNRKLMAQYTIKKLMDKELNMFNDIITSLKNLEKENLENIFQDLINKNRNISNNIFNKTFEENIAGMDEYAKTCDYAIMSFLFGDEKDKNDMEPYEYLNNLKENEIEDSYEFFLYLLSVFSRIGGFSQNVDAIKGSSNIEAKLIKLLQNSKDLKDSEKEFVYKYTEKLLIDFNKKHTTGNIKIETDMEKTIKEIIFGNNKKYFLYEIIVPPMLKKINAELWKLIVKEKQAPFLKILNNKKYWENFIEELCTTQFELFDITFYNSIDVQETNTIFFDINGAKLKGDYGEMINAVALKHNGIDTKYQGSKASNIKISNASSTIDTLITVNNNKYGIQVKEYSKLIHNEKTTLDNIHTDYYSDKNRDISFSKNKSGVILEDYFSYEDILILGSLLEIFTSKKDSIMLNNYLATLDLSQIRIVTLQGVEEKVYEEVKESDVVYTTLFRSSGVYIPSSYILFKRYLEIEQELKKEKGKIKRDFYHVGSLKTKNIQNYMSKRDKVEPMDLSNARYILSNLMITNKG